VKCTHRVDFEKPFVTLMEVFQAVAVYNVPETATVKEHPDSYDLVIEWEDEV